MKLSDRGVGSITVIIIIVTILTTGFLMYILDPVWSALYSNMLVQKDATTAFLNWMWFPGIPIILIVIFAYWFFNESQEPEGGFGY